MRITSRAAAEDPLVVKIQTIESNVIASVKTGGSLNGLADLLGLMKSIDIRTNLLAAYAAYRIFVVWLLEEKKTGLDESLAPVLAKWLRARFDDFLEIQTASLHQDSRDVRTAGMEILMSLSQASAKNAKESQDQTKVFRVTLRSLLLGPSIGQTQGRVEQALGPDSLELISNLVDTWLRPYCDARYLCLRELRQLLSDTSIDETHRAMVVFCALHILGPLMAVAEDDPSYANTFLLASDLKRSKSTDGQDELDDGDWRKFFDAPKQEDEVRNKKLKRARRTAWSQACYSPSAYRALISSCWTTLLPHLLASPGMSAQALPVLHSAPKQLFNQPVLMMDWVAGCVDYGGSLALVSLSILYDLLTVHNLDYPQFYHRLYQLLDREILHLSLRSRVLRLLERFLSSSHLPTHMLASFVKRLSRLCLSAPPGAIVAVLPLVYNLLKRHPPLMVMIHNPTSQDTDPYDATSESPFTSNAINSSLWELATLRNHYNDTVSTIASIFAQAFNKPSYNLEEFLDQSYATMFKAEASKKSKVEPALSTSDVSALNLWA